MPRGDARGWTLTPVAPRPSIGSAIAVATAPGRTIAPRAPGGRTRFSCLQNPLASPLSLFSLGKRQKLAARQPDLALAVHRDDFDLDLVALLEDVFHTFDPLVRQLGDVHEAIGVGKNFDE